MAFVLAATSAGACGRAHLSNNYGQAYTAWFESRLGFKGYSVTTDNALLFHLFGETKTGSQVMIGNDGNCIFRVSRQFP